MMKFKALVLTIAMFTISALCASAQSIDSIIDKSEINKNAIVAVSIKDAKTGKVVYEHNQNKLMNPASIQKIFTMRSAYKELSADYYFNTYAYIDGKNNLYIKLGADPTLTSASLKNLLRAIKEMHSQPFNDIVLDPSIIDNKQWGIGWMWDDDSNPYLPKYSPFTINENKILLSIDPGQNGGNPSVVNKNSSYLINTVNYLKNGDKDNLTYERMPWLTGDMTSIRGTVKNPLKVKLPVDSPERYFINELNDSLAKVRIKYTGAVKTAPIPVLKPVTKISSESLEQVVASTLKNSNNLYAEMIFKTAGGHYSKKQGTTEDAVEMFNKYYSDIKSDKPVIVDGCGISRNDLLTADWITEALNKLYKDDDFERFVVLLPKPIEGTLSDRLLNISLKLRAKTGTASGISSIAGYIDTKSNKKYSFAIMIQNHAMPTVEVKRFEDLLINAIYENF